MDLRHSPARGRCPQLHPQLGYLGTQPLELLTIVPGQPLGALDLLASPSDPVAQGALVHAQIAGPLRDRLTGFFDGPDRTLTELPIILLTLLRHRYSS